MGRIVGCLALVALMGCGNEETDQETGGETAVICDGTATIDANGTTVRWAVGQYEDFQVVLLEHYSDAENNTLLDATTTDWKDGQIVRIATDQNGNGEEDIRSEYTWEDDRLITTVLSERVTDPDTGESSWPSERLEHSYANDLLSEILSYTGGSNTPRRRFAYEYEDGRQTRETYEEPLETLKRLRVRVYDEDAPALDYVEQTYNDPNGQPDRMVLNRFDEAGRRVLEQEVAPGAPPMQTEWTYFEDGKLKTRTSTTPQGEVAESRTWTADGLPDTTTVAVTAAGSQVAEELVTTWTWTCE